MFKQGKLCEEIFIIVNGEVEIYINNNKVYDILVDTLFSGCSIGSYSCLKNEQYTISGMVKTDCTAIIIPKILIDNFRILYDEVNTTVGEYERYISDNGLPYLDYKIHRSKNYKIPPIQKFQNGIRRISRIAQSYKINDLQGFLMAHQKQVHSENQGKSEPLASAIQKRESQNSLYNENNSLELRVNIMMDFLVKQSSKMDKMYKEIKKLRKDNLDLRASSDQKTSEADSDASSCSEHNSEPDNQARPIEKRKLLYLYCLGTVKNSPRKLSTNKGISFNHVSDKTLNQSQNETPYKNMSTPEIDVRSYHYTIQLNI